MPSRPEPRRRTGPRPPSPGDRPAPGPARDRFAGPEPSPAATGERPHAAARDELRVFGLNACLAVHARRPAAIRKVYLREARMPVLRDVLRDCAARRIGYRVVADDDLARLTGSQHHEGVCFQVLRPAPLSVPALLARIGPARPAQLAFLDGVGNPHNLGAILRSAAHFGVDAVLLPGTATLALSGAACRVAEGGAEAVPLVAVAADDWSTLRNAGFQPAATLVRGGASVFATALPARIVWLLGAEGPGLSPLFQATALKLAIPGTGAVDSLNVAAAAAVLLAEHARQHGVQPGPAQ
jgi:TrmH RNA methyltransferase